MIPICKRVVCALLAVAVFCGDVAGAKNEAAAPAKIETVQQAIAALKAAGIIYVEDTATPESQQKTALADLNQTVKTNTLTSLRSLTPIDKKPKLSKELLEHFTAFQQGREALKDYPYIEAIIHLYKFRRDKLKRFPAGALEPFYAVAECRPKNIPLLVQACYRLLPEHEITMLLATGEKPIEKDEDGETALHAAARCCLEPKTLRMLIRAGASVTETNKDGYTPLHLAAQAGANAQTLRTLFQAGKPPKPGDLETTSALGNSLLPGITPVLAAMESCTPESVQELVRAGLDIYEQNSRGYTALHILSLNERLTPALLKMFAKKKDFVREKCIGERSRSALLMALPWMDEPLLEAFIAADAKCVSAMDADKRNCLHYLMSNKKATPKMLQTVLKAVNKLKMQYYINMKDSPQGWTPLHCAVYYACPANMVKMLISSGANMRIKDKDGRTPYVNSDGRIQRSTNRSESATR